MHPPLELVTMRRPFVIVAVAAVTAIGACSGKKEEAAAPRTKEEQRAVDSTIGASALPGARGVQGALKASDSAAARQKQLDSIAKAP